MKAAYITHTGSPDVIEVGDLPEPVCGPRDVLVRVTASSVNPIDTYIRSGVIEMAQSFPYIIGCDFAGTVEAIGPEVKRFKVGERVWGSNQSLFGRAGTCAELIAVDECWVYPTPSKQTDESAAAGALVGLTARLGLSRMNLQPGDVLFVNGGSGAVGSAVIQFARAGGVRVVASAGSPENREYCQELGAELALDYKAADIDDQIRNFTQERGGLQGWWETQREPDFDRMVGLMAKRGRIVIMAGRAARPAFPVGPFYTRDLQLIGFAMFNATPLEQRVEAERMNLAYEAGLWAPRVGARIPLAEAASAHQLQEDNTLGQKGTLSGKIVITL